MARRTPTTVPKDSLRVVVPCPVQDHLSAQGGATESGLEVLIVHASPTHSENGASQDGHFSPGYGSNAALSHNPMAAQFVPGYGRNAGTSPLTMAAPMWLEKRKALFSGNHKEPKGFWSLENLKSKWNGWNRKYNLVKDILDSAMKGPGIFKEIGSEARSLLMDDYIDKSLGAGATCNDDIISLAAGTMLDKTVIKLLFSGKYCNSSLALNATTRELKGAGISNTVLTKLVFHNVLGPNTKALLHIPYPYLNGKFELRSLQCYAGYTGHIESGAPHVQVSCLLGTHLFAAGGMLQINAQNHVVDFSVGATSRTSRFSAGLVMNKKDTIYSVDASFYKVFENKLSSLAVCASHSFENQPWAKTTSVAIGACHKFPHSVALKGRVSSSGVASVLLKKSLDEKCCVVICSNVDLGEKLEAPKFGVLFTIR